MNYIKGSEIINRVANKLSTWFDSNQVDESVLYPKIEWAISKMGLKIFPEKSVILEIENGEAILPKDFYKLCMALACVKEVISDPVEIIYTEEQTVCELNLCETVCDVCTDDCGNMFKVVQKFPRYHKTFTSFDILCPTKRSLPECSDNCFNFKSRSKNQVDIINGKMITNYNKALVYVEYIAFPEMDGDYLIPDNPTIIEWIEALLVFEVFQVLYFNNEPNILQRMQIAEKDLFVKSENARTLYRRSEFSDFYNMANYMVKRYNRIRKAVWNNELYEGC